MENRPSFRTNPKLKLMERVDQALAYYQYADKTKDSYCRWIREYIAFLGKRKVPENRFQKEINPFLRYLVLNKKLSKATQDQARNAIVFLYKRVFDIDIGGKSEPVKIRKQVSFPIVIAQQELKQILQYLGGKHLLMAKLLYGSGLRLMECIRLRVHHLDFRNDEIHIHPISDGQKRKTIMPESIRQDLLAHIKSVKEIHHQDIRAGHGEALLPLRQQKQYRGMEKEFDLQYVFPAKKIKTDPQTGIIHRPCVLESGLQKAIKTAVNRAGIKKRISCSTFRHSFAVHLLENNTNIYTVKRLMGHSDIRTTQMYTHMMDKKDSQLQSPLDWICCD